MSNNNVSVYDYLSGKRLPEGFDSCHNFYDWFCKDSSLAKKEELLKGKAAQLAFSPKIDINKMYVWYKNNCPIAGSLYDDLRFSDMETMDVIYTVVPAVGYDTAKKEVREGTRKGLAEVWGRENNFDSPLVVGSWQDVLAFFFPKGN